jgi:hypothetical protein
MGYYIGINCICTVKPEYINYIKQEYFDTEILVESIPEEYQAIFYHWFNLDFGGFREFDMSGNVFTFEIKRSITHYKGLLESAYMSFLKNIIAPISSHISYCYINRDDDYDLSYELTDEEVRSIRCSKRGFYCL